MVLGDSPFRLLVKAPSPVPSEVMFEAVVGAGVVLQHTPLAFTVIPPPDVTFPPPVAEVWVIAVMASVVTVGTCTVTGSVLLQELKVTMADMDINMISKEDILIEFIVIVS